MEKMWFLIIKGISMKLNDIFQLYNTYNINTNKYSEVNTYVESDFSKW